MMQVRGLVIRLLRIRFLPAAPRVNVRISAGWMRCLPKVLHVPFLLVVVLTVTASSSFAASACLTAFSPSPENAAKIFVKMTEQGVLHKHIDIQRVEEVLRALEQGVVSNPFESLAIQSQNSGRKAAIEFLIVTGVLRAQEIFPLLREAFGRLQATHQTSQAVKENTERFFFTHEDEKITGLKDSDHIRVVSHPDGTSWLAPPSRFLQQQDNVTLYEVSGLLTKKKNLQAPRAKSIFIGFDKNGDDIWASSTKAGEDTLKIELMNMAKGTSYFVAIVPRELNFLDVGIRSASPTEHFLVVKQFRFVAGQVPLLSSIRVTSINNPTDVHEVRYPQMNFSAGYAPDQIYQKQNGKFVYYFSVRDSLSAKEPSWFQWIQGSEPIPFDVPNFSLEYAHRFHTLAGATQLLVKEIIDGQLVIRIYDIDSGAVETPPALSKIQDPLVLKVFYMGDRPYLAMGRFLSETSSFSISIVDLETRTWVEDIHLQGVAQNPRDFIVFQSLQGDRLAAMRVASDKDVRILVRNIDHPEISLEDIVFYVPSSHLEYVRSAGEERLLLRTDGMAVTYKIYGAPPQAEVKP